MPAKRVLVIDDEADIREVTAVALECSDFEVVVDGFVDASGKATTLGGRPMGLAQGRDGELYLSDDSKGRIWRIQYVAK